MKTIKVIIECSNSKSYSAYTNEEFDGFALFGYGNSVESTKKDFTDAYNEAREMYGCPELEFEFVYDTESFLQLYKSRMSLAGLQVITGINQKQLSHYLTGIRKPNETTKSRILTGLHKFARELETVALL